MLPKTRNSCRDRKPRLLDLYCCAGGCSAGYADAGMEVFGVDIQPQPKYPFGFHRGDAIEYLMEHYQEFDAVHASPPCQEHSNSTNTWKAKGKEYPELIGPTRRALILCGLPYVIENVPGAPLLKPVLLCGTMFRRPLYRHRLFETSFPLAQPAHPEHTAPQVKMGRNPKPGEYIQVVGHFSGVPAAREAMQINWMGQKELAQAIPPAYTRYVGKALVAYISGAR
jgi:DNA (cytosine-5)-methyltransferase 1